MPEQAPGTSYTREEVRRLLSVTERQLRHWERHNLIESSGTFSLPDLIALKTLRKLQEDRIPVARIRMALAALRKHLRDIGDPLRELKVIADGKRIRVEIGGQHMEAVSGQLLFDFNGRELRKLLSFPGESGKPGKPQSHPGSAEHFFQKGLGFEKEGATKEAILAYQTAVQLDPRSAGAWVNLGTINFNSRQFSRAETCYRKAIEADSSYALAHFNLGNLFDERGDYGRAVEHYQAAVTLNPQYADAHYNLALLHQGGGHVMDAVRHWKQYLRLDGGSSWAAIARRELEKLRRSALVRPAQVKRSGRRGLD